MSTERLDHWLRDRAIAAPFDKRELRFFGELAPLSERRAFAERIGSLRNTDWIVSAKPPFGGPEQVLSERPACSRVIGKAMASCTRSARKSTSGAHADLLSSSAAHAPRG
ncbi:hypothetical protein [Methylosinus sp. Sm6]|uniref:hypothetical protein n=1 Tax=Methylosinus sp. Sm6 TaxID=2866948 RepID=UPI001C99980B|nr:hypothetical protein [Methylosinus sp. Sm6]MBY6242643.1 hypothetical protein [Methylosinus sp. Sm6]